MLDSIQGMKDTESIPMKHPRILTICPSINDRQRMMDSFFKTSKEENDLVFSKEGTVTQAINSFLPNIPGYDFVHLTNDDVVYRINGWDTKFIQAADTHGPGIYYGNDLVHGEDLCTFPFISTSLIQALGWIQEPSLIQYYGDTVWYQLGKACNCLHYLPGIIIEHLIHTEADRDIYIKDSVSYGQWLGSGLFIDKLRLKTVI